MNRKAFITISNPRTGSTHLITSLGLLRDIEVDFELKWNFAYELQPVHKVIRSPNENCRDVLEAISPDSRVVGSKLVFDLFPTRVLEEIDELSLCVDADIRVVHLTRNYWDVLLSTQSRGAQNIIDTDEDRMRDDSALYTSLVESTRDSEGSPAPLRSVDLGLPELTLTLASLLKNDVMANELARRANHSLHVDYAEIDERLPELAHFIGSDCGADEVRRATTTPVTKKLEKIPDEMIHQWEEFKPHAEIAYKGVLDLIKNDTPVSEVWVEEWKLRLPGLSIGE